MKPLKTLVINDERLLAVSDYYEFSMVRANPEEGIAGKQSVFDSRENLSRTAKNLSKGESMTKTPTKTIFWNVDTQKDFMEVEGTLPVWDALSIARQPSITRNLGYLTLLAEWEGLTVINTGDFHTWNSREIAQYPKSPDFKKTFPFHCMESTPGYAFIRETEPQDPYVIHWRDVSFDPEKVQAHRNIIIYKDEFDCFHPTGAPHTEKVLNLLKPERVVVYGVATNVCVNYAVIGLLERGIDVYIPTDAIKELPNLPLEEVLQRWKENGAELIKTKVVRRYLGGRRK